MSFDSPVYLIFLPAVLLLHRLVPAGWRWALLLCASYVFYARWDPALSLLILGVTACSFLAGLLTEKTARPALRRAVVIIAAAACLGVLLYFKYFDLLGQTLSSLAGTAWRARDIVLPVGISFYTFQALSYVIDVYRRRIPAEKHFGYYALYISFFPQLVAGPIERAGTLLPQLRREALSSREDLATGLRLIVTGFFRKLAVADLISPFVDAVYGAPSPDGSAVAAATLLFAVQILCDFSGYSEIAMGSARLLGIRLMANFDRPYGAASIRDFWRRWHISLTRWFTDYVYIPLGGSRRGPARQLFATAAVFALCGLWHGASWNYLVWGLLHAGFMAVYTLWRRLRPEGRGGRAGQVLTFAAVSFAWLFFRAGSMERAHVLLGSLLSPWQAGAGMALLMSACPLETSPAVLLVLLGAMLLLLWRLPSPVREAEGKRLPDAAWAGLLLALLIAVLIRMDAGGANAFIYFQF